MIDTEPDVTLTSGYVYVLQTPIGLLKIGHTKKLPQQRAAEWGLTPLAYAQAADSAKAERMIHERLAPYRQGKYELFAVPLQVAAQVIEAVVGRRIVFFK